MPLLPYVTASSVAALCIAPAVTIGLWLLVCSTAGMAILRSPRPLPGRLRLGLSCLALSTLLSGVKSFANVEALKLAVPLGPGSVLFLVVAAYFDEEAIVVLCRVMALLVGVLATAVVIIGWQSPGDFPDELVAHVGTSLFVEPNDVCFLAVMLPAALVVARLSGDPADKVLAIVAALSTVAASVIVESRLGVAASIAAIVLTTGCLWSSTRYAVLAGAVVAAWFVAVDSALGFAVVRKSLSDTWLTRFPPWAAALRMYADSPVLGQGLRTYGILFDQYFARLGLPNLMEPRHTPWAHNLYLETLAEQGVLGCGALLAILAEALTITATPSTEARTARSALRRASHSGIIVFAAVAMFETTLVRLWAVIAFASWLGIAAAVARPAASARTPVLGH